MSLRRHRFSPDSRAVLIHEHRYAVAARAGEITAAARVAAGPLAGPLVWGLIAECHGGHWRVGGSPFAMGAPYRYDLFAPGHHRRRESDK